MVQKMGKGIEEEHEPGSQPHPPLDAASRQVQAGAPGCRTAFRRCSVMAVMSVPNRRVRCPYSRVPGETRLANRLPSHPTRNRVAGNIRKAGQVPDGVSCRGRACNRQDASRVPPYHPAVTVLPLVASAGRCKHNRDGRNAAMTDHAPLSLHVPEPEVRPGGTPDFSNVAIPKAGSVPRPPVDVDPSDIRDLAYSIIRVLNRDGEAVGPWAGTLTDEELLEGLRHMMTLRAFDARMQMAQRQGKTSFYMQHLGEEAVSCAFRMALEPGDMNFPTYRQAGLLIAGGYPMVDMMNQIYSNERDPLKGRQLPVMYSSKEHGFFSISGNLATQYHPGRRLGDGVGDHATTRGSPPPGSATARRRRATSTPRSSSPRPTRRRSSSTSSTTSGRSRPSRASRAAARAPSRRAASASAFRRCGSTATTISPSMPSRNGRSSARARNLGPTLVEYVTYRVGAHSTSDDPSAYRPKTESDAWPLGDPVIRLKNHLIARGAWSRRAACAGRGRNPRHGDRRAEGGREPRHAACRRQAVGARHVRGRLCRRCRRICAASASRRESEPWRA